MLAEIQLERILATLEAEAPAVCVIDSIQTLWSDILEAAPGTVSQVRAATQSLIRYAKGGNIPAGKLHEVYCPMAKASWLQADKTVRNPYFGPAMLDCGQIKG